MNVTSVIIGGDGEPQEPDWKLIYQNEDDLELAHLHWGNIIREMRECQTLSVANGHAIRRLTDFRIAYERASRAVAEQGPLIASKKKTNGGARAGQWNPWWSVLRHAEETIRHLETELGISPLRRGRAGKVQKRSKQERASDTYLKKKAV